MACSFISFLESWGTESPFCKLNLFALTCLKLTNVKNMVYYYQLTFIDLSYHYTKGILSSLI